MPTKIEIEGPFITKEATKVAHIRRGSKKLTIEINPLTGTAASYLENRPGEQRISGETTSTYRAAKKIMQEEARSCPGGKVEYCLETAFPKMRRWIETTGNEIFCWDSIHRTVDDSEKIKAHVVIQSTQGGAGKL